MNQDMRIAVPGDPMKWGPSGGGNRERPAPLETSFMARSKLYYRSKASDEYGFTVTSVPCKEASDFPKKGTISYQTDRIRNPVFKDLRGRISENTVASNELFKINNAFDLNQESSVYFRSPSRLPLLPKKRAFKSTECFVDSPQKKKTTTFDPPNRINFAHICLFAGLKFYLATAAHQTGISMYHLAKIITTAGGSVTQFLGSTTRITHYVTSNYVRNKRSALHNPVEKQEVMLYLAPQPATNRVFKGRNNAACRCTRAHYILPQWVIDSVLSGIRLPESDYTP